VQLDALTPALSHREREKTAKRRKPNAPLSHREREKTAKRRKPNGPLSLEGEG